MITFERDENGELITYKDGKPVGKLESTDSSMDKYIEINSNEEIDKDR